MAWLLSIQLYIDRLADAASLKKQVSRLQPACNRGPQKYLLRAPRRIIKCGKASQTAASGAWGVVPPA